MKMNLIVQVNGFDESVAYVQKMIGKANFDTMVYNAAIKNVQQVLSDGGHNITVIFEEVC